jgi:hypothetical protein
MGFRTDSKTVKGTGLEKRKGIPTRSEKPMGLMTDLGKLKAKQTEKPKGSKKRWASLKEKPTDSRTETCLVRRTDSKKLMAKH